MYAFKAGVSVLDEATMNSMLSLQPFLLIYDGTERDAKTGDGVAENSIAEYSYCTSFTLSDSTEIGRVELELDRDGAGADLIVQIREGMDPENGDDGTLLKEVVVPKEFIPTTATYWSVPIGLTDLVADGQYWLVVLRSGDAANKLEWIGEASQDVGHPAYRRAGDSGAWASAYALHFKIFSGVSGLVRHIIEGGNAMTTIDYSGGLPAKLYSYIPPSDGPEGGVRDVLTLTYSGGLPVEGE